jgi:hypothetical protein
MATVSCKSGVRFKGFTRALVRIVGAVLLVAERTPGMRDVVITSANDGRHSKRPRSRHYTNEALDIRSRTFPTDAARQAFLRALRSELGRKFWCAYEGHGTPNAHFHVQARKGTVYRGGLCGGRRETR